MVVYDVDLGPSQLRQLDGAFRDSRYQVAVEGDKRTKGKIVLFIKSIMNDPTIIFA